MIRKVEMERFTLISSKPFDQVLAAINDAIGHPDMAEFWRSTHRARSVPELESTIEKAVGKAGLMLFVEFDHGAIVRKETGRDTPRMIRFVIGNPLIMKEMVKHSYLRIECLTFFFKQKPAYEIRTASQTKQHTCASGS